MGFTDLVSSGRGPGIIGTLIALFVLAGFGTLYVLVFDESTQGGKKTITAVVRDQGMELEGKKTQLAFVKDEIVRAARLKEQEKELRELTAKTEATAKQIEEAKAQEAADRDAVAAATKEWEDYKSEYRTSTWAKAKGRQLGTLKTASGGVFENAVIRKIDHAGMDIICSSGPKNIKYEELPVALQDEFQFDVAKRDEFVAGAAAAEGKHIESVEYAQTAERIDAKIARVKELKGKKEAAEDAWKQAKDNVERFRIAISRKKSEISAEKRKSLSKAPQMEIELRRMQAQADQNNSSISALDRSRKDADTEIRTLQSEITKLNDDLARMRQEYAAKKEAEAAAAAGTAPAAGAAQ